MQDTFYNDFAGKDTFLTILPLVLHKSVWKSDTYLFAILQENLIEEGHIVLIFSQTRKMLNLIQVLFLPPCVLVSFTLI